MASKDDLTGFWSLAKVIDAWLGSKSESRQLASWDNALSG